MNLKDLHARLGVLIEAEDELAQAKQSLTAARTEIMDLRRRLEEIEKELRLERVNGRPLLTPGNERWLLKQNARLEFSSTRDGKFKAKLRTGRRADGRPTELLLDPPKDSKGLRVIRKLIEEHKAR